MNYWFHRHNRWRHIMLCVAVGSVFLLFGCATRREVFDKYDYTKEYATRVVHDTLREHFTDSVYVEVLQKGDTIFQTKYKEVTRWRDRIVELHDTCYKDSIVTEYKESVKEVKYVPKIYKISMCISILLLIFALVKLSLWLRTRSII